MNNKNRKNNDNNFFMSGSRVGNKPRANEPAANAGATRSKSFLNRSRNFFGFGKGATNNNAAAAPAAAEPTAEAPAEQSGSVFNRIFSFTSPKQTANGPNNGAGAVAANGRNNALVNAINQLKVQVNGNGAPASLPSVNQRLPTATLVNGILKKMSQEKEKLEEKITELNTRLRNQKMANTANTNNALKNKEKTIRDLKNVIRKLYALLYKIYSLHTVSNNQRSKYLNEIQQTLVRNKNVLNVVNRIIAENNQILETQRNATNLAVNTQPLVLPNANAGNEGGEAAAPMNRNGNRNRNGSGNGNGNGNRNRNRVAGAANANQSGINSIFRNIGEIPSNNRPGEVEVEQQEGENQERENQGQMNLVVPDQQIAQIMAQERANENVSLSNLVRKNSEAGTPATPEEQGNTVTANRESPEETAEMPLNNNVMGRAKSVSRMNRSKKIMAVLRKMEPISVNNALAKLRNY